MLYLRTIPQECRCIMSKTETTPPPQATTDAHEQTVPVWDLPTRVFHWTLVTSVILLVVSGETGVLAFSLPLPNGGAWTVGNMDSHMFLGELVLALVLFRLMWGVMGSSTARFVEFVRGPKAIFGYLAALRRGELPLAVGHNPAGGLMIVGLLLILALQASLGLFSNDDIFSEGPLAHLVSSSTSSLLTTGHRIIAKLLLLMVFAHVSAALYYLVRGENLIRPMVLGRKPAHLMPAGAAPVKIASLWKAIPLALVAGGLVWGVIVRL